MVELTPGKKRMEVEVEVEVIYPSPIPDHHPIFG